MYGDLNNSPEHFMYIVASMCAHNVRWRTNVHERKVTGNYLLHMVLVIVVYDVLSNVLKGV